METTLDAALAKVFAPGTGPLPPAVAEAAPAPADAVPPTGGAWQQLAVEAGAAWEEAERARVAGDWAAYGAALEVLEARLGALRAAAEGGGVDEVEE